MDEGGLFFYALWSEEDQEWIGLVYEYPSLSWLAPTEEEALEGIKRLVEEVRWETFLKSATNVFPPLTASIHDLTNVPCNAFEDYMMEKIFKKFLHFQYTQSLEDQIKQEVLDLLWQAGRTYKLNVPDDFWAVDLRFSEYSKSFNVMYYPKVIAPIRPFVQMLAQDKYIIKYGDISVERASIIEAMVALGNILKRRMT